MSVEEQQAAIGRTVREYAACKTKLAALSGGGWKNRCEIIQTRPGLASASRLSGPNGGATVAFVEQNIDGFPGADAIVSLVSEIARELEKKNTIQTQLKKMGCETEDWA